MTKISMLLLSYAHRW